MIERDTEESRLNGVIKKKLLVDNKISKSRNKNKVVEQMFVDPYSMRDGKVNREIMKIRSLAKSPKIARNDIEGYFSTIEQSLFVTIDKNKSKKMENKLNLEALKEEQTQNYNLINPVNEVYFRNLVPMQLDTSNASKYANFLEFKSRFGSTESRIDPSEESEKEEINVGRLTRVEAQQYARRTVI